MSELSHPAWLDELLKEQDVSKEVLLQFKKHYLTTKKKELGNDEL